MKRAAKSIFGLLSLVIGTAILIWCGYCLFDPNKYFRWHLIDIPRLAVPLGMIWLGWSWMRGDVAKRQRYSSELTVTLKLSDSEFGTQTEREAIFDLKHRLEDKLDEMELGEIDGEEFGNGECCVFVRTNSPTQTHELIREFFSREGCTYALSESTL